MSPSMMNTLRQKAEAADAANRVETERLAGLYAARLQSDAAPIDEAELRAHVEALLAQLSAMRPRLAADLRTSVELLAKVAARNREAG